MSKLQLAYKQIYQQGMQVVFNHKYHPLKGLVGTVLGVTHYRVKIALAPNGVDSDVIILTKPKYLDVYHQPKGSSDADNGSQPNESLGVAADSKETTRNLPTTPQGNPIQPIIPVSGKGSNPKTYQGLTDDESLAVASVLRLNAKEAIAYIPAMGFPAKVLSTVYRETGYKTVRKFLEVEYGVK